MCIVLITTADSIIEAICLFYCVSLFENGQGYCRPMTRIDHGKPIYLVLRFLVHYNYIYNMIPDENEKLVLIR